ncbi:putative G-protein coupled receptor 160 [Diretmus argenteus]
MSAASPISLERRSMKMLAIVEHWEGKDSCHIDNTVQYLFLMLFKLGLDAVILNLCWRRLHTSFLSACSLSIVLADVMMVSCMASVWVIRPAQSPELVCLLLAQASATFKALPLPMVSLGLLDYVSEDSCTGNHSHFCKVLRNVVLVLLVWVLAVVYSLVSVTPDLMEIEYMGGANALVCEVQESMLVSYFVLGIFIAVTFTLLPYWSSIPRWFREANRIADQRGEPQEEQKTNSLFNSMMYTEAESDGERFLVETVHQRPSLGVSLTLGFASIWMPYLVISVACLILGFAVPAYIVVNALWLECTNSLLVAAVFWAKSSRRGPYSHLPDDVCLWRVHWHLSRGTYQQKLPDAAATADPSDGKGNALLHV